MKTVTKNKRLRTIKVEASETIWNDLGIAGGHYQAPNFVFYQALSL